VVYAPIDFAREDLRGVLRRAGFQRELKTFYICEGLSMYVPEEGMRETLRVMAAESGPGSSVLFEYLNRGGLEVMRKHPTGMLRNAVDWGAPFVFGVPEGQDREFFQGVGWELGQGLKIGSPESVKRYAMRRDGSYYGAHLAKAFEERRAAGLRAMDEASRREAERAAASSGYWLAELRLG
jgi:methyltransferase (TIGR00027 family)